MAPGKHGKAGTAREALSDVGLPEKVIEAGCEILHEAVAEACEPRWRTLLARAFAAMTAASPPTRPEPRPMSTCPEDATERLLLLRDGWRVGFWSDWNRYWTTGASERLGDHVEIPGCTAWLPLPGRIKR
jgi:hypothetical protein